ncbi:hypothetical protein [Pseudofrankia sp. BMG5.37]|uniref:hypothetical protein n=1 Tax=Pseudofrankia sp. BMG5.37 TaxID=3050035 RepID=UPI0028940D21|nr:hypothetical protein [Pseudofrankia sp. BMG5.37]MDT3443635.1 hypothetical protein [Pseudofrankia sp. BMG5.37]
MDDDERFSLEDFPCPAGFRVRSLHLEPHDAMDWQADWAEALVVVEQGEMEIECASGARARFDAGAVLTFDGLSLRRLHNCGETRVVVTLLSRQITP